MELFALSELLLISSRQDHPHPAKLSFCDVHSLLDNYLAVNSNRKQCLLISQYYDSVQNGIQNRPFRIQRIITHQSLG